MSTLMTSMETGFNLISPSGAKTDSSIALLWRKPTGQNVKSYEIYVNDKLAVFTGITDHTLEGLIPDQEYEIQVCAITESEKQIHSNPVKVKTKLAAELIDITDFGAVGDNKTLNTKAIQAAIDACPVGGKVYIPAGVFLSGAIFLKSDMTLYLDKGATLYGSNETKDYPMMEYRWEGRERICYASLINTVNSPKKRLCNITIAGQGTINGNGSALRQNELAEAAGCPSRLICIRNTDNVYLQDITVRQSPAWCVHPIYCTNVCINKVSIHTRYDEDGKMYEKIVNGDGLDPDSCRDVYVFNSHIASQDDCIAIKSGRDEEGRRVGIPSENIRISNCRFTSGLGVAVGSEMSGGIRNVLVEDCVFTNTFSIASVKAPRGRGSVIENITYRNCTHINRDPHHKDCEWFRGALYIDNFYSHVEFNPNESMPRDETTPVIRNILFQHITLDTTGGNAIYLTGLPESPLENIRLENINAIGKYGFVANNVHGLILDNVFVKVHNQEII